MVINHEITIFDFSCFFFAILSFWVVKSHHESNVPVYPVKRRIFFASYRVQRTQLWRKRVLKKAALPTCGSNGPIYTTKSAASLHVSGSKGGK